MAVVMVAMVLVLVVGGGGSSGKDHLEAEGGRPRTLAVLLAAGGGLDGGSGDRDIGDYVRACEVEER